MSTTDSHNIFYMSDYCKQNLTSMHFEAKNSWIVLSPIEKRIKEKIEKVGKPLKDWDINIYRGEGY